MLLLEHLPGWASYDPPLELPLLLGLRIVRHVTKLHRDFFVGFQEESDGHRQEEIVEREDEDEGPGVIEGLVDRVVL